LASYPDLKNKVTTDVDPRTGALRIRWPTRETLRQLLPDLDAERVTAWSKMPIFRVQLFFNRKGYTSHGPPYTDQIFEEPESLARMLCWWRRRVGQDSKGFAVFQGGFDGHGAVHLTEPPLVLVDALTGEIEADDEEAIQQKLVLYRKRRKMKERWTKKGMPEESHLKIESAEKQAWDRKRHGQEYLMQGGWVHSEKSGLDVKKHNFMLAKHHTILAEHNALLAKGGAMIIKGSTR